MGFIKRLPITISFLLLAAVWSKSLAQGQGVEQITIADGLSQGMVYDIEQTKDGFLWFATKDGLNRYDGNNFLVFTNDPFNPFSIAGNDISSLFEDNNGSLWMGFIGKGLGMMEPVSGKFYYLDIPGVDGATTRFSFEEGADGTIQVLCGGQQLSLRWEKPDWSNPDLRASMRVVFEKSNTVRHPYFLSSRNSKAGPFNLEKPLVQNMVYAPPSNGKGVDSTALFKVDKKVTCYFLDQNDNLWLGTTGYGLRKINLSPQPFRHLVPGTTISNLQAADSLYLRVHYNVIGNIPAYSRFDEISNALKPTDIIPKGINLFNMCRTRNGSVGFLGCDEQGQSFLGVRKDGKTTLTKIFQFLSYDYTTPLIEDSKGRFWTCIRDGRLMCILPTTNNIAFFDLPKYIGGFAPVYALYEDAGHQLWVGTKRGILRIPIADLGFRNNDKGESEILPVQGEWKPDIFNTEASSPIRMRHNFISSFCPDPVEPERFLWISTKGGGLHLLDIKRNDIQYFTSQNSGLPNDVVYGILPENSFGAGQGSIWGSTNRGLFRLSINLAEGNRDYHFRNFRQSDGLQGDEFNTSAFAKAPYGHLAFGGVNGLTVFHPAEIEKIVSVAPLRLTGLKINNLAVDYFDKNGPLKQPLHQTERIDLDFTQNLVTLEFALLNFRNPAQNNFRYRLQGVDPEWVYAGTSHTANYAHLRPGDYTFEVQGSYADGPWSDAATLRIVVAPPWWVSWWAYVLYALSLAIATYAFYKFRLRQKLEHKEAQRLKELDEFKNRFFTNITHEFRTPLTVILGMTEQIQRDMAAAALPIEEPSVKHPVTRAANLIKRNGENLLRLINQILDLTKLENKSLKINYIQGDILPYLRYIAEGLHSFANAQNVLIRVETRGEGDQEQIVMDYDPERLLQIVYNLLSNAIKFTPSGGRVTIRATAEPAGLSKQPMLLLSVSDTGVGISADDLPHVFDRFFQVETPGAPAHKAQGGSGIGLSLTRELIKAMGGDIQVESEPGKGATFTVRLPITNDAEHFVVAGPEDFNADASLPMAATLPDTSADLGLPQILLMEDNPDVVEYLSVCLGDKYQLTYAYNGRVGIEKALETIPDLIVSDVMMPEKDGFEVCETLKHDERTSHIPIVLLTAKADAATKIAGLRIGADVYLAKPFDREELLVQLEMLLKKQQRLAAFYSKKGIDEPDAPTRNEWSETSIQIEDAFIQKIRGIVAAHYEDENFGLPQLCQKVGMSRSQLFRKMTALMATSPSDFIRSYRLRAAKNLLETSDLNVSEVAWKCGFVNLAHFSKIYQEAFGVLPSATNK